MHHISIIIAAYKAQDFIEECLNSIENQTYFKNNKFEIILGIDGCEYTLDKILKIQNKYRNFKVYMMDSNEGPYVTINTLIQLTRYNNIIRFDADDIMRSNMIEEISKYIEGNDIVQFRYNAFEKNISNVINPTQCLYPHGVAYYNKKIFRTFKGWEPWRCAADSEFLQRVSNNVKIFKIDKPLFYRRVHDNSLTKSTDFGMRSEIRKKYKSIIINKKANKGTKHIKLTTNNYKEING